MRGNTARCFPRFFSPGSLFVNGGERICVYPQALPDQAGIAGQAVLPGKFFIDILPGPANLGGT